MNRKPNPYTELCGASLVIPEQVIYRCGEVTGQARARIALCSPGRDGETGMRHLDLYGAGLRGFAALMSACTCAGCQSQTDSPSAREQARQGQRATPTSVVSHIAAARAGALLGEQKAVQQNIQEMTRDILHDAHVPDASRPIDHEVSRTAVQPLPGVRSAVWIDHDNLLVMVGGPQYRNMAMVDSACDALAPLGDTMGVVVNVQDVTATTPEGADAVSRNCQLPEGQRAFLRPKRQIEALDPAIRKAFKAQQGSSTR
ncbi:MAG: hypothetical protein ACTHJP_00120 [Rhodanobacteraceae bacterium]